MKRNNKKVLNGTNFCKKKVLVITDNLFVYKNFKKIATKQKRAIFKFRFSFSNKDFLKRFASNHSFQAINVNLEYQEIIKNFDLVISAHSKQLFPEEMVKNIKCINIHPGYNPYNRGWYPHVFSIINKQPIGATIHEIDEKIDHGFIIDQVKVPLYQWDTSESVYERVLQTEISLVKKNIKKIIANKYYTKKPRKEGNLNTKKDFNKLCKLDISRISSFRTFINLLRALTHGNYDNAYFIDQKSGKKIYISINLKIDEKN
jgi:methionyl-tRNA formyltransferase